MSFEPTEVAERPRAEAPLRDGIGEEDHPIPLWFNVAFYGAIVFGILYILYFELSGWSQAGRYAAEVERAAKEAAVASAAAPAAATAAANPYRGDAGALAEGQQVFATVCAACHLPDGRGLVGPSLVDPYWKYGRDDGALFETVSKGRPAGMPAWASQLGPEKIWKVLLYMETLPRSDAPGVGAPGYQPPAAPAAAGAR